MEEILNAKELINKEEDLYLSFLYFRLKNDLEVISNEMEENKPEDVKEDENIFVKGWKKGIVNPFKQNIVEGLSEKKAKATSNLEDFEEKYEKKYEYTKDELKASVDTFFEHDKHGEAKMLFGIKLALSNEYEYYDEDDSLNAISEILFDDETRIVELYKVLRNNYLKINNKDVRDLQTTALISLGMAAAITVACMPVGLAVGAASGAALTGTLVLGALEVTGGLLVTEALLTGAYCGYLGYKEIRNNKELKKKFREITPDDLALKLAIKATLIEEINKVCEDGELIEYIDSALGILDDYRADAEYMLIVEKLDAKNAKKKIQVCNNLSVRLAEIVGI